MVKAAERKREVFDFFKENADSVSENRELVNSVRELIGLFGKVIRGYKLYPRSNPAFTRFADQFKQKLDSILNDIPSISFKITTKGVMLGNTVLEATEKDSEIVSFLYNDGLRELFFQKGTSREEISALFNVLAQCTLFANEDYDLPTLLWDNNFDNIGYITEDELVSQTMADSKNSGFSPFLAKEFSSGTGDGERSGHDSTSESSKGSEFSEEEFERYSNSIFREKEEVNYNEQKALLDKRITNHSVGKMEMTKFEEALKRNSDNFVVNRFLKELSKRLLSGQGTESGLELLETASRIWEKLLLFGSIKGAVIFIKALREIAEKLKETKPDYYRTIKSGLSSLEDKTFINDLFTSIGDFSPEEIKSIGELFGMIPPSMTRHLVIMINSIDSAEIRTSVLKSFSGHMEVSDELIALTSHEDWKVVRNALYLMRGKQDPRIVPAIRQTLSHPQKQARVEALGVLTEFSIEEALPALEKAVFSSSREIRGIAIRKILELKEPKVKAIVNRMMHHTNLSKLEPDEISEYFRLIVDLRRNDLYDLLANNLFLEDPFLKNKAVDALLYSPTLSPFSEQISKASTFSIVSKMKKEDLRHFCKLLKPEIFSRLLPRLESIFHEKGGMFDKNVIKVKEIIFRSLLVYIDDPEVKAFFKKGLTAGNKETVALIKEIAGDHL